MAHLSHKIRWDYLAEYVTPFANIGISFPVSDCGRIHLDKRKHDIQVEMRKYITDDMICTEDCPTTGMREFRRNNKRGQPFQPGRRGDPKKFAMFADSFYKAVHEFAITELTSTAKPVDNVTDEMAQDVSSTFCEECNDFFKHLEFGDKAKLLEYSNSELNSILRCQHGGQAVGNSVRFFLYHIFTFYIYSNAVVHLNLKPELWPEIMKPTSYFRRSLTHACDGQTFLPYSRKYLATAMTDLNDTRSMMAHLSHKIHWDYLAEYVTPFANIGISLPVGDCGKIHLDKRKHELQVEMRKYITDDMICTADCPTTGMREFRRNNKRGQPFQPGRRGDPKKFAMFADSFYKAVHEFAITELTSTAKPVHNVTDELVQDVSTTNCKKCNDFFKHLEFGDKAKLLEYSNSELNSILGCQHGGQAVGNSVRFFLDHIVTFYIYSNAVVYLNLKPEQWPEIMKPTSYFRSMLTVACDGQTFLPYSRKYLATAMIDLNDTRELSKRLFRCIYLYVFVRLRLDSSYKLQDNRILYFGLPCD